MPQTAQSAKPARIDSVDFLRGLVIVIMALDHVRDYVTNVRFDPLDLEQTNAALYLTRWITHFCAPVFVFLAGTAGGFQRQKGKSVAELSRFLLTRGLWLIFLELTVVLFGWKFNFAPLFFLQVIWAIGASMIALTALVWLPLRAIAAVGAVMILGHNFLDGITAPANFNAPATALPDILWVILHQQAPVRIGPATIFFFIP